MEGGWVGRAWLSGEVLDSQSRGAGLELYCILWDFRVSVVGQGSSETKPRTGETQERHDMNNRRGRTEILLKAA